jgi:very-short-patch-repair endonuclease
VLGSQRIGWRAEWLAAVLAFSEGSAAQGEGAALSHRSAGALWGILSPRSGPVHVTARQGRGRRGITLHHSRLAEEDRTKVDEIPVTSVARTLFDLSEELDERGLEKAFEEADRLHLLQLRKLEAVCERSQGRRGLGPTRRMIQLARAPAMVRSPLEERFLEFCHRNRLPPPVTNVTVLDHEVDALWPSRRVVVELDGFEFHGHRAAFERDRTHDAAMVVAGYHVIHLTHLRLEKEAGVILAQLRALLEPDAKAGAE